jgi:hypothetical protein
VFGSLWQVNWHVGVSRNQLQRMPRHRSRMPYKPSAGILAGLLVSAVSMGSADGIDLNRQWRTLAPSIVQTPGFVNTSCTTRPT